LIQDNLKHGRDIAHSGGIPIAFFETKEASNLKKNVKSAKKDEKTAKNKFKNRT
jgi:hypothetical protein